MIYCNQKMFVAEQLFKKKKLHTQTHTFLNAYDASKRPGYWIPTVVKQLDIIP